MVADLRRIILEACVLVAFGGLAGLSLNHDLVLDAFSGRVKPPVPASDSVVEQQLPSPVLLAEVQRLAEEGALLIDARAPELYAEGHLPAAISLPLAEAEAHLETFRQTVAPDRTLIVYCSGYGCPDSFDLAVRLIGEGYQDVRVFEGGFPEWRDAGLPVAGGES